MARGPRSILFACRENSVRSPMAAALARQMLPGTYVASAGVVRGLSDPFAAAVLQEIGIDLTGHAPAAFEDLEDGFFDLIVTLAPEAHHRAMELTRNDAVVVEYWPTPDATAVFGNREQRLAAYREVRDLLARRIRDRFQTPPQPSG
jgi:protein-tyrosine-phosphatase